MKKYILLSLTLAFQLNLFASSSYSVTQWLGNTITTAANGIKNTLGIRDEQYCISPDQGTPQLYLELGNQIELTLCSDNKPPVLEKLTKEEGFINQLHRIHKRSFYDWKYTYQNIAENKPDFIEKLIHVNFINISPLLNLALQNFLHTEYNKRGKEKNEAHTCPLESSQQGYLEWCQRIVPEAEYNAEKLLNLIEKTQSITKIEGNWQKADRWLNKQWQSLEQCKKFVLDPRELKKTKAIYQNFAARVLLAAKTGKTLGSKANRNEVAALFDKPEFQRVYNQVWFRAYCLETVLIELLAKEPSIDVCAIYENHWQNISPIYTSLIADIILAKKQPQEKILPKTFISKYKQRTPPINKLVFLLCSSLDDDQQKNLLKEKVSVFKEIQSQKDHDAIALNVHAILKGNNKYQSKLLTLIAKHKSIKDIFSIIERKKATTTTLQTKPPIQSSANSNNASSSSSSSNAQSTPQNINTKNNLIITQNTMSNSSSPQKKDLVSLLSKVPENSIPDLLAAIELWQNSNPNNSNATPTLKTQSQSSIHSDNNACFSSSSSSSSHSSSSSCLDSKTNKKTTLKNKQSTSLPTILDDYTPSSDNRDINSDNANAFSYESDTD